MHRFNRPLAESLPTDDDRRNFRSSPTYRGTYARLESYAELVALCRKQDHGAVDGFSRRAAERLRMQAELRRLDTLPYRAGFPQVSR
jgi:hypothetical protein